MLLAVISRDDATDEQDTHDRSLDEPTGVADGVKEGERLLHTILKAETGRMVALIK